MEKQHNIDLSKMPFRTWFYEGQTFVSPSWKQQGKPYIINKTVKSQIQPTTATATKRLTCTVPKLYAKKT